MLFTLPNNEYTRKAWTAALIKEALLQSNIKSTAEHCSDVIVLLCTAKTERMQSLMGTLTQTDSTSNCNHERGGSRPSVASRMRLFVTTVSCWELLGVVTKKSILVPARVLDPPLLETEMS